MSATEPNISIPDYVCDFLRSIATKLGFIEGDSTTLNFKSASNVGDGYLGSIDGVSISSTGHSSVHLVCKMMPADKEIINALKVVELFKREVLVYEQMLPVFEKFQRSKGLTESTGFFAYPKCYGCICDEKTQQFLIVMDDLRAKNYRMWPKMEPITFDHVQIVIRKLAKLHAVSFALKDQQPSILQPITCARDMFHEILMSPAYLSYLEGTQAKMISVIENNLPEHAVKFRKVCDGLTPILNEILNAKSSEPFTVLAHGDCWGNNTMIRYNQTSDHPYPDDVSFVDWQFSNYTSPALDVLFYIFSVTDKRLRDQHYHELLRIYETALHEAVTALGSDAKALCPHYVLDAHFKKFGTVMCLLIPSTIDCVTNSGGSNALDSANDANNEEYRRRIVDFAEDLIKFGYI